MRKIICIGGATIDRTFVAKNSLVFNTSNPVAPLATSYGGVARNVAENLSRLSTNIVLQCLVGNDADGEALLAHLHHLDVDVQFCPKVHDKKTAHYDAINDTHGELIIAFISMEIYNDIDITQFTLHWDNWEKNSIIFLDTNLPANIIEYAIKHCRQKKHTLCIDPVSVSKTERLPDSLAGVYLLKPNRNEISHLTQMPVRTTRDCFTAGKILLDRGVENVIISLGKEGYVIINDTIQQHIPAFPVTHILDANGAGDAFMAGILYGLKQNYSLLQACEIGAATAAVTLQSLQTVSQHLNLSQINNLLNPSYVKDQLNAAIY